MDYEDFLKIANYLNEVNRYTFTEREVKINARFYKADYDYSIEKGKPCSTMETLCRLLLEDMDKADYEDCIEFFDNVTMNRIFSDFLTEI